MTKEQILALEGKSPEEVWNAWTVEQRNHFIRDHFDEINWSRNFGSYISLGNMVENLSWSETSSEGIKLPNEIKMAVSSHVKFGQYGKGTSIPSIKHYYLKPGALFRDSSDVKFKITGHTPTSLKVKRHSEVEKNTPEIEIPYLEVLELVSDKKMVFDLAPIDKIGEFRLLEMEIENIKLNFKLQEAAGQMLETANKINGITQELTQVKAEANALMDGLEKNKKGFKDSLDAMEAIAKKEKKKILVYKGISEEDIDNDYGKELPDGQGSKEEKEYFKKLHKALLYFEKTPGSKFYIDGIAGKGKEVSDSDAKLEAFLAKFPDNAKSWAQATDEMRDLARDIRERYEAEADKKVTPIDFRKIKTPSEWNKKAKKQIRTLWAKLPQGTKEGIIESHEGWFE